MPRATSTRAVRRTGKLWVRHEKFKDLPRYPNGRGNGFKTHLVSVRIRPGALTTSFLSVASRTIPQCTTLTAYSKHWPCLFPQHGLGLKHDRPIVLDEWQVLLIKAQPRQFLRGLIHSDGNRCLNVVTIKGRRYAYPRYFFTNRSRNILDLFVWACELVGVQARQNNRYNVNVARRADVALLDTFIGPKA